jgi:hypothetical protein
MRSEPEELGSPEDRWQRLPPLGVSAILVYPSRVEEVPPCIA